LTYTVNVDTTSIATTSGYLDLQFNPGGSGALAAGAFVTQYSGGSGFSVFFQNGDASGSLPGDLTFDNATPLNELTFGLTYGMSLSFDVTLSGVALGASAPDGSTFAATLFDDGGNPYSDGPATATITIDPNAATTAAVYPPIGGTGPTATVTLVSAPEPSTMALAGLGMAALMGWYQVRRRAGR
jgi:hypothetical protein